MDTNRVTDDAIFIIIPQTLIIKRVIDCCRKFRCRAFCSGMFLENKSDLFFLPDCIPSLYLSRRCSFLFFALCNVRGVFVLGFLILLTFRVLLLFVVVIIIIIYSVSLSRCHQANHHFVRFLLLISLEFNNVLLALFFFLFVCYICE